MNIFFYPYGAIEYIGKTKKEFTRSLIRPNPIIENGDVLIMTELDAYNTVKLFPTEFKLVKNLEIDTDTIALNERIKELEAEVVRLETNSDTLTLNERIKELETELNELSLVVANHDAQQEELNKNTPPVITSVDATSFFILKAKEEFAEDKDALAEYALDEFGIELDIEKGFDELYEELSLIVNQSPENTTNKSE
jgi:hypothetical protein